MFTLHPRSVVIILDKFVKFNIKRFHDIIIIFGFNVYVQEV